MIEKIVHFWEKLPRDKFGGFVMKIVQVLLLFVVITFAAVHSKVIYLNFGRDHPSFLRTLETGIIHVPGEKQKCKGDRTPDKNGNCRRIVEF